MSTSISTDLQAQKQYLLAGSYTSSNPKGIHLYSFNAKTGDMNALTAVESGNPSYMAVSQDNRFVYTTNEHGDGKGAVSAFQLDYKKGSLNFISSKPSNGDHPCYISLDKSGKWLVTGNYSGGNFSVYRLRAGIPDDPIQIIRHQGSSINKDRQEGPHVHAVVFSPDNKYLAVTDLGTDQIMLYPFDASKPTPVDEKPIVVNAQPGSGPRHIIFHPNRPYFYTLAELTGHVTLFSFENAQVKQIQSVRGLPTDFNGEAGSAAIHMSADNKFLYSSNRGDANSIAVFSVDQEDGTLTLTQVVDAGIHTPRDFTIDPSGKFLLCGNQGTDNIMVFHRDPKTGHLRSAQKQIAVTKPVFLTFLSVN